MAAAVQGVYGVAPLLFRDVPSGTPYWEFTAEGTQGNVVRRTSFVTEDGGNIYARLYDARGHVNGGVLMELPDRVELWCQPAEE